MRALLKCINRLLSAGLQKNESFFVKPRNLKKKNIERELGISFVIFRRLNFKLRISSNEFDIYLHKLARFCKYKTVGACVIHAKLFFSPLIHAWQNRLPVWRGKKKISFFFFQKIPKSCEIKCVEFFARRHERGWKTMRFIVEKVWPTFEGVSH